MWRFLLLAILALPVSAVEYPPNEVTVQMGVGTKPPVVVRRVGNTSPQPLITINKDDKLTVLPAVIPQTTAWVRLAMENEAFAVPAPRAIRFGDGLRWATTTTAAGTCSVAFFGADPKPGQVKFCEMQITVPAVVQVAGMPTVNKALIPMPAKGAPGPRIRTLSAAEQTNPALRPDPSTVGAFREPCGYSHINFDDPITNPGEPGASKHAHIWFGNGLGNFASTPDSLLATGDSTCAGGTLNRTAYWAPLLLDLRNGQALLPVSTDFYYKLGYFGVKAGSVQPFPKGLRMIAGNSKNSAPISGFGVGLECVSGGGHQPSIPSCPVGDDLNLSIIFPQCWDGKNLDSPDHKSHMAYAALPAGCPVTHPVPLPEIALNMRYRISEPNSADFLALSSDMYVRQGKDGGRSMHADWFGAWDPETNRTFIRECVNGNMDCHAYLLGDGRILY